MFPLLFPVAGTEVPQVLHRFLLEDVFVFKWSFCFQVVSGVYDVTKKWTGRDGDLVETGDIINDRVHRRLVNLTQITEYYFMI